MKKNIDFILVEKEISFIVEKRWKEIKGDHDFKIILELAVLDGYKAGLEHAREIYSIPK